MVRSTITLHQLCPQTPSRKRASPLHMRKTSSLSMTVRILVNGLTGNARIWHLTTLFIVSLYAHTHTRTRLPACPSPAVLWMTLFYYQSLKELLTSPPPRPHPHSCSDTDRHQTESCSHTHILCSLCPPTDTCWGKQHFWLWLHGHQTLRERGFVVCFKERLQRGLTVLRVLPGLGETLRSDPVLICVVLFNIHRLVQSPGDFIWLSRSYFSVPCKLLALKLSYGSS